MAVLLIATLDTKGTEAAFVREILVRNGVALIVADAGARGEPAFSPDIDRETLFREGGTPLERVQHDRGLAIEAAARSAAALARRLQPQGVIGLGGSAGTTIATAAMRELPVGVPKVMVSTMASGQVRPYVGVRDVCMIHSVVDISGLNRISTRVLTNAAHALIGMLQAPPPPLATRPVIGATMFGVTTPCVEAGRAALEAAGYEVLVFHATGTGGQTLEGLIRDGEVAGVLDVTTTELADELVGGVLSAGPDRLTAASLRGIPQVISVGAVDMVNFGPRDSVPEKFASRRFHVHNPTVTLMRTTPDENDALGKQIAWRASASRGPVTVFLPLRGVSALDVEGGPFWWPEADRALFDSIRLWSGPNVKLIEMDLHLNDPAFAAAMVAELRTMLRR
jgi:uncharacterized protein (UPF0261 family)